jgi:Tol biopolymer transport system component
MVFFTTAGGEPREVGAYAATLGSPEYGWSTDGQVLLIRWKDGSNLGFSADQGGWSPDGEWRLVSEGFFPPDGGSFKRISVVRADGSETRLIGELALIQGDGGWQGPTWSPDGSRIAGLSTPEEGIRILDVAGAAPQNLVSGSVTQFSWSPDGRQIAFDELTKETGQAVSVVNLTTGDVQRLAEGYWPRWSPRGDRIAFRRSGSDDSISGSPQMVYTIRPDGTDLTLVAEATYLWWYTELMWSSDGEDVEFVRPAVVPAHLYEIDLRTAETKRFATELGAVEAGFGAAELSPEGDRMAFMTADGWFVMDIATGELERLYEGYGGGDVYWVAEGPRLAIPNASGGVIFVEGGFSSTRSIQAPAMRADRVAYSPDGKKLAVVAGANLSVASLEGDDSISLFTGTVGAEQVEAVSWSPSGDALLYTTSRFEPTVSTSYQLLVSHLEGEQRRSLLQADATYYFSPQWSPDGRSIALVDSQGAASKLVVIDADDGDKRSIAGLECCGGTPHWSPDGSWIALASNSRLDVIDVATGAETTVATAGSTCAMTVVGWSPDGGTLFVLPVCLPPQH